MKEPGQQFCPIIMWSKGDRKTGWMPERVGSVVSFLHPDMVMTRAVPVRGSGAVHRSSH